MVSWLKDRNLSKIANDFEVIASADKMAKLHMIHGKSDKLYYVE